ncbi:NAD(P)/FAD-dependent oxidoreductase [Actinomadura chibensis]|uniref:Pyridine nucleotide-disulfide oxidoreductase n=1 Tax=Actinomadura chibensis TaxID=392828 RepID=A0A5D0N9G2_9ACTN|nr:FAD-dependent oxidoreductase [Actinomadura chibensis]TYB41063.1 pyridine nucleotide-disulfide oxidoreductase [Actinomadura chibensis]
MATTPTYVIVGAGLAGGRAAGTLRAEGFDGRVVLVDAEPHPPYERPPLSKELILGTKQPADARVFPESFYRDNDIDLLLGTGVARLDPARRRVELAGGGTIPADKVLLATGTRPRPLPVPGADLEGVHHLRTLDDAAAIRAALLAGGALVLVGGGFIGAELAASARALGNPVTMIELDDLPMRRVLGPGIAAPLTRLHRERGVRVLTRTGVERIEGDAAGRRVRRVVTTGGEAIDADLVVVGIGVRPNDELAARGGLDVGDGVRVDARCVTSHPDVYAAGDVARHPNPVLGESVRLEHFQNAQDQGIAAARSMLGKAEPYAPVPWFWSDQYDLNIQMSGHPRPTDAVVWRGEPDEMRFTACYLRDGVLVAAIGVNRPRDVRAATRLIAGRARPDPRLLADAGVDVRHTITPKEAR